MVDNGWLVDPKPAGRIVAMIVMLIIFFYVVRKKKPEQVEEELKRKKKWSAYDPIRISDYISVKAWIKLAAKYDMKTSLILSFIFYVGMGTIILLSAGLLVPLNIYHFIFFPVIFPIFLTLITREYIRKTIETQTPKK